MLSSYKAVFFDAGGTLFRPFPSVGEIYQKVAAKYGCKAEAGTLESLFRQTWVRHDGLAELASHCNEKVEKDWWKKMVHEVFSQAGGVSDFEAFFDELYDTFAEVSCWQLFPDALEVLTELKRRKKRIAIISNWDSRLFKICEGFGIHTHVEFILASAVFGAAKPSPRIFEEALRRTKVSAAEAVHIGDSFEDDIRGARAVGMSAIWINQYPLKGDTVHPLAQTTPTIRQLKDLILS